MTEETGESERHGTGPLFILFAVAGTIVAAAMMYLGARAPEMSGENLVINKIMHEVSAACTDPTQVARCRAARKELEIIRQRLKAGKEKRISGEANENAANPPRP